MKQRNIIAAIDVGSNTITCIVGSDAGDNKIDILGHSMVVSAGVRRGIIINVEEVALAIKAAIKKATLNINVAIKKVYVNMAGHNIRTIEKSLSKSLNDSETIQKSDIEHLLSQARNIPLSDDEKVYHVINQSYSIDGEKGNHNPVGLTGSELVVDYKLIIGPKNYEEILRKSLQKAGVDMVKCVVNPIAAGEAVLNSEEKEAGVVLVDMGGGTTSISVYYDSVLRHLSIIPFGGNVITNDIREGCSIIARQAEALKVKYGSAMGELVNDNMVVTIPGINGWEPKEISFKNLAYIIQARMEEIVESVFYQIVKSGYAEKLGAGIVLTGGGAKLNGIKNLVQFKTGLSVRIGTPSNGLLNTNIEKAINTPQHATAFGLLRKTLSDKNTQGNIFIERRPKKNILPNYGEAIMNKISIFFDEVSDDEL